MVPSVCHPRVGDNGLWVSLATENSLTAENSLSMEQILAIISNGRKNHLNLYMCISCIHIRTQCQYSYGKLKSAQLLGQLGIFLTNDSTARGPKHPAALRQPASPLA